MKGLYELYAMLYWAAHGAPYPENVHHNTDVYMEIYGVLKPDVWTVQVQTIRTFDMVESYFVL